jgi:hypothetical protein
MPHNNILIVLLFVTAIAVLALAATAIVPNG